MTRNIGNGSANSRTFIDFARAPYPPDNKFAGRIDLEIYRQLENLDQDLHGVDNLGLGLGLRRFGDHSSVALKKADNATRALVAHRAPAALELARVGRMVNVIGYATYRAAAEDGPTPAARQAKADIDGATAQLLKNLETAERLLPENAATYRTFAAQANRIAGASHALAREAQDLARLIGRFKVAEHDASTSVAARIDRQAS